MFSGSAVHPGQDGVVVAATIRCLRRCGDSPVDRVRGRQESSGWATMPWGVLVMVQVRMSRPSQPRSCCWKRTIPVPEITGTEHPVGQIALHHRERGDTQEVVQTRGAASLDLHHRVGISRRRTLNR